MNITSISASGLRRAATIKEKIESLQKELSRILGGGGTGVGNGMLPISMTEKKHAGSKMSAAGRARIAAAAKARWAKAKAAGKNRL